MTYINCEIVNATSFKKIESKNNKRELDYNINL